MDTVGDADECGDECDFGDFLEFDEIAAALPLTVLVVRVLVR